MNNNVKIYLVGGYIRNIIWDLPSNDFDFCLTGSNSQLFCENLGYNLVGKSFPVYFDNDTGAQFALARSEKFLGNNKYEIQTDNISIQEDLQRRDFTINSLAYEVEWKIENNKFVFKEPNKKDIINGLNNGRTILPNKFAFNDLDNKILRNVRDNTFIEDPLRILRGFRFLATYNLKLEENTKKLFNNMIVNGCFHNMESKRIYIEFLKTLENRNCFFNFIQYIYDFNLQNEEKFRFLNSNLKLTDLQKNINSFNFIEKNLYILFYDKELFLSEIIDSNLKLSDLVDKYSFSSNLAKNILIINDFIKIFNNTDFSINNSESISKIVDFITKYKLNHNQDLVNICLVKQYLKYQDIELFNKNLIYINKFIDLINNIDYSSANKSDNPKKFVKDLKINKITKNI